MQHGEHSGELLAGQTQPLFPGTMADTSTGENDIATKDEGYGIDATQEFGGGEDSDKTPPPAEELGYQFKATDGVSSHKANTFRTQELYQREVFQHSQRTYHPGLSASMEIPLGSQCVMKNALLRRQWGPLSTWQILPGPRR